MRLWAKKDKIYIIFHIMESSGNLKLLYGEGVNLELKKACIRFRRWLIHNYSFPVPIPVYLENEQTIRAADGDDVVGLFFEPYDRDDEPNIRIAVGDYDQLSMEIGRDDAIASILHDICHELTHYFQWINDIDADDDEREEQANCYAQIIKDEYARTRKHP